MQKIRKGDEVVVLAGRDQARRGVVLARVGSDRVLVEGINMVKKHSRGNPMAAVAGGIIDKAMPTHFSNVALCNPGPQKGDRVGFKQVDGTKVRVCRSHGAVVGAK